MLINSSGLTSQAVLSNTAFVRKTFSWEMARGLKAIGCSHHVPLGFFTVALMVAQSCL